MRLTRWQIRCDSQVVSSMLFGSRKEAKAIGDWFYKCKPCTRIRDRPYTLVKVRTLVVS